MSCCCVHGRLVFSNPVTYLVLGSVLGNVLCNVKLFIATVILTINLLLSTRLLAAFHYLTNQTVLRYTISSIE